MESEHAKVTDERFEPSCYAPAKSDPKWCIPMDEEHNALMKNDTWLYVLYSPHMNLIGCKRVFRVKRKAYGTIECHKARLVAKGFNQQEGIDYGETFSPLITLHNPCCSHP